MVDSRSIRDAGSKSYTFLGRCCLPSPAGELLDNGLAWESGERCSRRGRATGLMFSVQNGRGFSPVLQGRSPIDSGCRTLANCLSMKGDLNMRKGTGKTMIVPDSGLTLCLETCGCLLRNWNKNAW